MLEVDTVTRAVNQLARTYTAQYDAFNRHLSGIKQQVAAEGGQAIVGNVAQAAAVAAATARQTPFEVVPALTLIFNSPDQPPPRRFLLSSRDRIAPVRCRQVAPLREESSLSLGYSSPENREMRSRQCFFLKSVAFSSRR